MDHPILCNSKKLLLQGITLEAVFEELNPRSLLPHLDQFEISEELQDFLDMANARVSAAKEGKGKPIHNPHGFLLCAMTRWLHQPIRGLQKP
jgi:hypothetical protein